MSQHTAGLAIETAGLVKTFGETRAVDGVDLAVPTGTVYGVLGPNGAGKTTTVKMLATLLRPDGGQAHVFGQLGGAVNDAQSPTVVAKNRLEDERITGLWSLTSQPLHLA